MTPSDADTGCPSGVLRSLIARNVLQIMADIAAVAGAEILDVRSRGISGRLKADQSPVTDADERAERLILGALEREFPDVPAVGEETAAAGRAPEHGSVFFLVDPLDGTREFVAGRDEFTVNVALICGGAPVAGAVYAPVAGRLWLGDLLGDEPRALAADVAAGRPAPLVAHMPRIRVRATPASGLVALVSRSHPDPRTDAFLARAGVRDQRPMGSSVKFCLMAEGQGDVYPRFSRTMEWDTAAGDAVLRAAGGLTLGPGGAPLLYGKPGFENPDYVAWATPPAP